MIRWLRLRTEATAFITRTCGLPERRTAARKYPYSVRHKCGNYHLQLSCDCPVFDRVQVQVSDTNDVIVTERAEGAERRGTTPSLFKVDVVRSAAL